MTPISMHSLVVVVAVAMLAACTPPAGNEPATGSKTDPATPTVDMPSVDTMLAMERRALEAYMQGDGSYFQGILSDNLVMQMGGTRIGKSDVVNMIAGTRCQVQDGWALTEPQLSRINADTFAISYRSTIDGSCTAGGVTARLPSPVRTSSVWTRNGTEWQAVFHGEVPIVDPAATPASDKVAAPEKDADAKGGEALADPVAPASDPVSDALMAAERSIWEAWMKKDADTIKKLMAGESAFVNLFGSYFPDKAAALADWTSEACEVSSFMLSKGVGSSISPTVGILTVTGTVTGTCGGQDISGQKIHATTVYTKEGEAWKWAFGFNSPD